jgi:nucleoside-diphosphate-sugar epimerase
MATEHILLTGATGNVGAVTLEHLLETPHTINAIVRNAAKAIPFFTSKYPDAVSSGKLVITSIPDMAVPGVFDEAAATATAIIHVATPLATSNFEETMIKPTWAIDYNVLEAAKKSKTVKRVIICGSILQTMTYLEIFDASLKIDETRYNGVSFEAATQAWGPAYQFSKTNAEKKTWEWVRENKETIDFDVVMLLPPSITGRSPQMGYTASPDQSGGIGGIIRVLFTKEGAKDVDRAFPFIL